jgi:hypothetical protein
MNVKAVERIREILHEQLDHATTIVDLMKRGIVKTRDQNGDSTEKSIADTQIRIRDLNEAIERLNSLAIVIEAER